MKDFKISLTYYLASLIFNNLIKIKSYESFNHNKSNVIMLPCVTVLVGTG